MSLPEPEPAEPATTAPAPAKPSAAAPRATEPTTPGTVGRPVPDVQPMEVDLTLLLMAGTGLFALAFVGLLAFHSSLHRAGHGNWPWIALTGAVFGLLGSVIVRRRGRGRDRAVTG
jgi:hypothetical protein